MSYAYVENGIVIEVKDTLPNNWRNVSNFFVYANDYDYLKQLGWYPVEKQIPTYNPETHRLDNWQYIFDGISVKHVPELIEIIPLTTEQLAIEKREILNNKWEQIRNQRDRMMKDFEWRYTRYERQVRLSLTPTDSIESLDNYMQALADITAQSDPDSIIWPTFMES